MKARVALAVVAALALGAAGGWVVAASQDDTPVSTRVEFDDPVPLRAADPSLPVLQLEEDPDDPALPLDVELEEQLLVVPDHAGRPTARKVRVPAPRTWTRTYVAPVDPEAPARWQFTVEGNDDNSFGLRVDIFRGPPITVERAMGSRQSAMRSARANGDFVDLEFTDETADGFVATYVSQGFQRVSMERFFSGPDPRFAYATITVFGRVKDRPGMEALLEEMSIGLRTG